MEIRKTKLEELDTVMDVYRRARQFMAEHNNPNQWGNHKPPREQIQQDIAAGKSYVCIEDEQIAAVFYFAKEADKTYAKIYGGAWLSEEPYGVVHRIASAGIRKGAATFCMNWALQQCKNVRIDTHADNYVMQNMLKKNGFQQCGTIYIEDGTPRLAFQKVVRESMPD